MCASALSTISKTINFYEDFQTDVYIKIQRYNKKNKISKNSHTKNKENIVSQKIINYKDQKIDR